MVTNEAGEGELLIKKKRNSNKNKTALFPVQEQGNEAAYKYYKRKFVLIIEAKGKIPRFPEEFSATVEVWQLLGKAERERCGAPLHAILHRFYHVQRLLQAESLPEDVVRVKSCPSQLLFHAGAQVLIFQQVDRPAPCAELLESGVRGA